MNDKVTIINNDLFYNNKYLGRAEILEDGYCYFSPNRKAGLYSHYHLVLISKAIKDKNEEWDKIVQDGI